jgi:TRAP-type C4-dicarboxylate transport system substrate-binding protein
VFADAVRRLTEGRVSVEVLGNVLDLGKPAAALLDMVETGELDLCYFSTSYLGKYVPDLEVLETPFLFGSLDQAHAALDGDLGAALTAATEAATPFAVLGYWDNGFRHFTNRLRDVRLPGDISGMRVRLQPNRVHAELIESWGGVPVPVDLSDGIRMIEKAEVDAQENPLANTVAYGVHEIHRYATMTGHLYGARGVYARPDSLSRLSARDQDLVRRSVSLAVAHQRSLAVDKELEYREFMTERGVAFVDLASDERQRFIDAARTVVDRTRSSVGADLHALIPPD